MAQKIPCQGKHGEFENFAKTQGILFAQVVNSLILKVQDIFIFAAKTLEIHFEWVPSTGKQKKTFITKKYKKNPLLNVGCFSNHTVLPRVLSLISLEYY